MSADRDRGQVLLIGAVAVAFVLLGLVVVYNAQLSARPTSTGATGAVEEAEELNREARRNARVLAVRTNHAEPYYDNESSLNAAVNDSFRSYDILLARSYGESTGAVVGVRYAGASQTGTRVVQSVDRPFTEPAGAGPNATEWTPAERDTSRQNPPRWDVGWLVLNLNVTDLSETDPFVVRVYNATDDPTASPRRTTYRFQRNETGSTVVDVNVTTTATGLSPRGATCNPTGNRSLVDLRRGFSFTGNCTFGPSVSALDGPHEVEFRHGDRATGQFTLVTNATASERSDLNDLSGCAAVSGAEPCNTPAVWSARVATAYTTADVSYENEQNVTVYEGV